MYVALLVAVVWSVASTRALEQAPDGRSKGPKGTERWCRVMQRMLDSAVSSWAWVCSWRTETGEVDDGGVVLPEQTGGLSSGSVLL
jgi:hypothetical protein